VTSRPTLNDHLDNPVTADLEAATRSHRQAANVLEVVQSVALGGVLVCIVIPTVLSWLAVASGLLSVLSAVLITVGAGLGSAIFMGIERATHRRYMLRYTTYTTTHERWLATARASIADDVRTTYGLNLTGPKIPLTSRTPVYTPATRDGHRVFITLLFPNADEPVQVTQMSPLPLIEDTAPRRAGLLGLLRRG
jgi:hypothetical protein